MENTNQNNEYKIYSTYIEGDRVAHVVKDKQNGYWGVHMKNGDKPGLTEYYPTHSESWAEDCAENFVLGIKKV